MADISASHTGIKASRSHGRNSTEYRLYFAVIFLWSLPFGIFGWLIDTANKGTFAVPSPIARALAEGHRVTPMIFSA